MKYLIFKEKICICLCVSPLCNKSWRMFWEDVGLVQEGVGLVVEEVSLVGEDVSLIGDCWLGGDDS